MTPQPIRWRNNVVAVATARQFFLCHALNERLAGDADRTFVAFMCAYAGNVARGDLAGPYSDDQARRFARACLIPNELVERPGLDTKRAAHALNVPLDEFAAAYAEAAATRRRTADAPPLQT